MLDGKILTALNKQINEEMKSAYIYLAMATEFDAMDLNGFANWMNIQVQEELAHAKIIYNYVSSRGGKVIYDTIDSPNVEWDSPKAIFEATLKHEEFISSCINNLMNQAKELKDNATEIFLNWFVSEQVEEEENALKIIKKIELAGQTGPGLYILDQELVSRVFNVPSPLAGA